MERVKLGRRHMSEKLTTRDMDTGGVEVIDLTEVPTRVPGGTHTYEEDKRSVDVERMMR
jgi:hypothetical protein